MPIILWLLGVPLSVVITAAPSFIRSRRRCSWRAKKPNPALSQDQRAKTKSQAMERLFVLLLIDALGILLMSPLILLALVIATTLS
jgi:hypothetical protein